MQECYNLGMSQQFSDKCPRNLEQQIVQFPAEPVDLLLRVSEVGQAQRSAIEDAGFTVRRQSTLIPSFAVSGPGGALGSLLDKPWLIAVEPDGPVRAL